MLGNKISNLRKSKKLTQKQLADELGISQSTIGMIEKNERGASNELLIKFSKYFNVSIDYLITTEEKLDMALDIIDNVHEIARKALSKDGLNFENTIYAINPLFDEEKFTKEELNEITNFIQYLISKRKNK